MSSIPLGEGLSHEALLNQRRGALVDDPRWPWTDDIVNDRIFAGAASVGEVVNQYAFFALHNPPGSNKTFIVRAFSGTLANPSTVVIFPIKLLKSRQAPLTGWTLAGAGRSMRTDSLRRSGEIYTLNSADEVPPTFELLLRLINSDMPIFPVVGAINPGGTFAVSGLISSASSPGSIAGSFIWKELAISLPDPV